MTRAVKFRARLAFRVPWWRDCEVCGIEFKWERAWVVHRLITAISTLPVYVCRGCAASRGEAGAVFADLARSWNPFGPDLPRAVPRIPAPPPPPVGPEGYGAKMRRKLRAREAGR